MGDQKILHPRNSKGQTDFIDNTHHIHTYENLAHSVRVNTNDKKLSQETRNTTRVERILTDRNNIQVAPFNIVLRQLTIISLLQQEKISKPQSQSFSMTPPTLT